ncbi:tetratricopeptide repeat protein [Rheinheimera maricola]|uniref:Tetratricopeptide repeat protein n=1 Tax=Rheinheimera maricola TaxID=2793282 RepID=A0ABS7XE27_9GAMM|nr:tetratricopeptide repeat protein [Rheinheimera maricola]MBZ9613824.1 hypothetical protein [Rheinheimera maricola]
MSVINKMLRDLEQRRSIEHGNMDIIRQQRQPLWLTILLCSTLLLAMFAIYAVLNRNPTSAPVPNTLSLQSKPMAVQATAQPAISNDTVTITTDKLLEQQRVSDRSVVEAVVTAATNTNTVKTRAATTTIIAEPEVMSSATQSNSSATDLQAIEQQADKPASISQAVSPAAETSIATAPPVAQLSITPSAPGNEQRAAILRQQALTATEAGQWLQAVNFWQQLQQMLPQQAQSYLAQARLWLQLGNRQQAELILQQARTQGIENADIQLLLAQAAASRQQWQQVDELLSAQYALAQYPQYYGLKATALQQMAQHQQALLWFDRLSQLQPQQAKWWLGAAISLDALARQADAKQYYRNALQWGDNLSQQSTSYIHQRLAATE